MMARVALQRYANLLLPALVRVPKEEDRPHGSWWLFEDVRCGSCSPSVISELLRAGME